MKKTKQMQWLLALLLLLPIPNLSANPELKIAALDELLELDLIDLTNTKVVVASKREEKLTDAPGIISVITNEEIEQFGGRNLLDLLNRVPSVQAIGSHFYSHTVSMRGQSLKHSNNEILFLINGRPHRTSYNGGANYSLLLSLPLESIDHLEIIRGPGSVLYGSSAFSGVINIVTKSAANMDGSKVKANFGTYNSLGTEAMTGFSGDQYDFMTSLKRHDTDGWNFTATGEKGNTDTVKMAEKNIGFVATTHYKKFSGLILYDSSQLKNLGSGARWPAASHKVKHLMIDGDYQQTLNASWQAKYHATLNKFEIRNDTNNPNSATDLLLEPTIRGEISEHLKLLFGAVYENQTGSVGTIDYDTNWYSFYAQSDFTPTDNTKLTGGFQWNKADSVEADISPRLALTANLNDQWATKLLYGKAFRSAYGTERFIESSRIKGKRDLNPENISTAEAQVTYHNNRHFASLSYYRSKITNVIRRIPQGGGLFTFENSGHIKFNGIELEGKTRLFKSVSLSGSASYQENKDHTGTKDVSLAPNVMAKIGMIYDSSRGYTLGLFDSYFGTPTATSQLNPSVKEVNKTPKAHHLVTANITLDIPRLLHAYKLPELAFSLYIDNLLDEDIYYPEYNRKNINSIPIHSGRAIYGTLEIVF